MVSFSGVGLGLRRDFIDTFLNAETHPDFIEVAPENWMNLGGRHAKLLAQCVEKSPLLCHGLSLSIGGPHPLNIEFVQQIKDFLSKYQVLTYSEHLSYTHDGGYLYDLLPIPMTEAAVKYVAERILRVQDILGQRLVIENVSTYLMPHAEMSEADFMCAVIAQADCELLLDVNNVYVNSMNHGSNGYAFIDAMPKERIRYLHIAGHEQLSEDLLIDTHGAAVGDSVWKLLHYTYQVCGVKPTLLERDFNIPTWSELQDELGTIKHLQKQHFDEKVTQPIFT
ncbi:HvfB family MNIO-type RiPP peptide maturase [Acinetobacter kyonggiensis]|uniref:UPF0276 protein SAMN05421643_11060 n=1 Tax=Acinetobacter kyonggiensis TaxID=595670 RepID=A0A1H3JTM7_9GAMM|nr:DUF692 domain-containing protein [Acinetobacter kyonggiensis]SDY43340.1 hypothetical protein SAMN05421643_11060 [Acinetobacter kyonggiensis]